MFIHEAAHKALLEIGRPTHVSELFRYINDRGYYTFGAKEPENALAIRDRTPAPYRSWAALTA